MQTFFTILSSVALASAACIVALNWGYVVANYRARRQGRDQHVSLIHLVPQFLVVLAAVLASHAGSAFPAWPFWLVALADPGLLYILLRPLLLLRQKHRAQT